MKIFGLGLTKSGTSSLTAALSLLGFRAAHYPNDPTTYQEILDAQFSFSFMKKYDAVTDVTVIRYFAQLDMLYPGSKFILTVRPLESWLEACQRHWSRREPRLDRMDFHTMIDASVYGCARFHKERFRYVYEAHHREVRRYFADRPGDLLEMNICGGDGWEPLCRFLDRPIPGEAFPHLHKGRKVLRSQG